MIRGSIDQLMICPWRGDKRWVYSVTFDEALSELKRFVVPILAAHDMPGHLEVVVGQLGQVRQIGNSSYNGLKHMGAAELREMLGRGWGVGNHSWSHGTVNAATAAQELGRAKQALEEAIGEPVTIYCAPNDNANLNDQALAACRQFGYLGAMSLTDALNRADAADLLWINRTFLHDQGYPPFFSAFDPFRNIALARRDRGWLVDYCHCPLAKPVHRNKDCSAAQFRERIETIATEGGGDVWLARVEEVVDYRYTRRAARFTTKAGGALQISAPGLPPPVRWRTLTLSAPGDTRAVAIDGQRGRLRRHGDRQLFEVDLSAPREILLDRPALTRPRPERKSR